MEVTNRKKKKELTEKVKKTENSMKVCKREEHKHKCSVPFTSYTSFISIIS